MQPSIESLYQDAPTTAESLSVMIQKEQTVYASGDYINFPSPLLAVEIDGVDPDNVTITESDRLKIVDWCYNVIDRLEFDREIVAMTMELVDRFLSKPGIVAHKSLRDRQQYQLVAMAALYISVKTTEQVVLGSDFFAALSHGTYSVADIESTELAILTGLSWRVHAPTSHQMACHILSLMLPDIDLRTSTWDLVLDDVRLQTEHAVRDYYFCTRRRSTVALAAILNALNRVCQLDRQALLCLLLRIMNVHSGNIEFDSYEVLKAATSRLQALVGANGDMTEEMAGKVVYDSPPKEDAS